jgi:hypothetical protein
MSQTSKIGKTATRVYVDEDGFTCVRYHDTVVIRFNDKEIILDEGGWFTNTTKLRINQASAQFNLGCYVCQKDYRWTIHYKDQVIPWQKFGRNILSR